MDNNNRTLYIVFALVNLVLVGIIVGAVYLLANPSLIARYLPGERQSNCQRFPETEKTVCGRFLAYWREHGGLAQNGFPLSEPFEEQSTVDDRVYTVQYFERTVFQAHSELQPPYDVQIPLLGATFYQRKYPLGAPNQKANTEAGSETFPETGKSLGGRFLEYWRQHGGLEQLGFPISDEFMAVSDLNGQEYLMQFLERAVLEYHPENAPPYDILLSHLGTYEFKTRYPEGQPNAVPTKAPAVTSPTGPTFR
jgi:hypothetical protein